jgi:hypothetical protein
MTPESLYGVERCDAIHSRGIVMGRDSSEARAE